MEDDDKDEENPPVRKKEYEQTLSYLLKITFIFGNKAFFFLVILAISQSKVDWPVLKQLESQQFHLQTLAFYSYFCNYYTLQIYMVFKEFKH